VNYGIQNYRTDQAAEVSIVYSPWNVASIYGNWGRTFQVGAGAAAYKSNSNDLRPSINDGWEAGVKFTPADWIDGRVAFWEQRASDEVKRVSMIRPATPKRRQDQAQGYDIQVNLRPDKRTSVWLAYSHQRSEIDAA